jgi:hypothetical protein
LLAGLGRGFRQNHRLAEGSRSVVVFSKISFEKTTIWLASVILVTRIDFNIEWFLVGATQKRKQRRQCLNQIWDRNKERGLYEY